MKAWRTRWKTWLFLVFVATILVTNKIDDDRRAARYARSEKMMACFKARMMAEKRRFGEAGIPSRRIAAIANDCAIRAGDPTRMYL